MKNEWTIYVNIHLWVLGSFSFMWVCECNLKCVEKRKRFEPSPDLSSLQALLLRYKHLELMMMMKLRLTEVLACAIRSRLRKTSPAATHNFKALFFPSESFARGKHSLNLKLQAPNEWRKRRQRMNEWKQHCCLRPISNARDRREHWNSNVVLSERLLVVRCLVNKIL